MLDKLPGSSSSQFRSAINDLSADVYVISLSPEPLAKFYRSKSTGLIVPLNCWMFDGDITTAMYAQISATAAKHNVSEEEWNEFQNEFEKYREDHLLLLSKDLDIVFQKLANKIVILLGLNTKHGQSLDVLRRNEKINKMAVPIAQSHGVRIIDLNDVIRDENDLHSPQGMHFKRPVYREMANRVTAIIHEEFEKGVRFKSLPELVG
jgi:hypothetical protein